MSPFFLICKKRYQLTTADQGSRASLRGLGEGMIDEKIDDLERLDNPTVGFGRHTRVLWMFASR